MADFTRSLAYILGRAVVDETGFKDEFDVHLAFAPYQVAVTGPTGAPDGPALGSPIVTALQQQLGLRLESTPGLVEVLIIDHVERPSEN